jgi:hypothetical protein
MNSSSTPYDRDRKLCEKGRLESRITQARGIRHFTAMKYIGFTFITTEVHEASRKSTLNHYMLERL